MIKQEIYPDIERHLKPQMEGNVYAILGFHSISGSYIVDKHYYLVENGEVYEFHNGSKTKTGDTLFTVNSEGEKIGKYDPNKTYQQVNKQYSYDELIKLLKLK